MSGVHVVLGARGGAGRAVVDILSARGMRVRAVSRSGRGDDAPGVEQVRGDAMDPAGMREVCRDAGVVYHCVNVPYQHWHRQLMPIAQAITDAVSAAGARLVVMDNLYMYGPVQGPMTEKTPRAPRGPKGRLRAELEEFFLDAHRRDRVRLAIGRASDFYGTGANSQPMILAAKPALAGRRAFWPANLDVPHTINYLPDVGRALVTLGERSEALGGIWHLPADEPLTGRQFIELVCRVAGKRPRMGAISRPMMRLAAFVSPLVREALEVLYQFERPFVMETTEFERTFGRSVTPHHEAVRQIVRDATGA